MKIPADVREAFADVKQIRKSPTKEVLEWLAAHSPEKALRDVAKALDEIQRNDALQIPHYLVPLVQKMARKEVIG